jgi:hypothetical protein
VLPRYYRQCCRSAILVLPRYYRQCCRSAILVLPRYYRQCFVFAKNIVWLLTSALRTILANKKLSHLRQVMILHDTGQNICV